MNETLLELEAFLEKSDFAIYHKLQAPLAIKEIQSFFAERNLLISENLLRLYTWKNGTVIGKNHPSNESWLIGFGSFLSLEDVFIQFDQVISNIFPTKNYLPFITDNLGEYYLFDLNAKENEPQIYFYSPAMLILKPTPVFFSIEKMFESVLECFRQEAFSYDNTDTFIWDIERTDSIMQILNPEYAYWSEKDFISFDPEEDF